MASQLLRGILALSLALAFTAVVVHADIAPTEYVGYGISPIDARGLRMASAQVDFTWGTPCTLVATFIIDNQTAKPVDVDLGFPVTDADMWDHPDHPAPRTMYPKPETKIEEQVKSRLVFAFNDVPLTPSAIAVDDPITRKLRTIMLPKLDFNRAEAATVVQFLKDKGKEYDPHHQGINFVWRPAARPSDGSHYKASITLTGGVSLSEALTYAGLQYSIEGDVVYLSPASPGSINSTVNNTWYRCHHTFPPGPTKVTVKTTLRASNTYKLAYAQKLLYCIETGGFWDGTIGSEEVDIHFPSTIVPNQIIDAQPKGYTVDGNTVRWTFKDFKPQGKDHDIEIEYMRPDVLAVLGRLRAELAHAPGNPALILRLAKNLFALGPYQGYAWYPPGFLDKTEYADLRNKISTAQDRALFQSQYILNAQGKYEEQNSDWTPQRYELVRILNAVDYQPQYSRSLYVDEAKTLVEKLLWNDPTNAEAWNVYFTNYYRFRFAGAGIQAGGVRYYPHEIAQIKKALALCPGDSCLQLWYQAITHPADEDLLIKLHPLINKLGIETNDLPKIENDYDWGASSK